MDLPTPSIYSVYSNIVYIIVELWRVRLERLKSPTKTLNTNCGGLWDCGTYIFQAKPDIMPHEEKTTETTNKLFQRD